MSESPDPPASQPGSSFSRGESRRPNLPFTVRVSALVINLLLAVVLVVVFTSSADGSSSGRGRAIDVLPPSDAREVFLAADATPYGVDSYQFLFQDSQGLPLRLTVRSFGAGTFDDRSAIRALGMPTDAPSRPISVEGLEAPVAACTGVGSLATNPPTALPPGGVLVGSGPMFVVAPMGGVGFLGDSLVVLEVMTSDCNLDDGHVAEIERLMRSLRSVTEPEWYAYAATRPRLATNPLEERPPIEPIRFDGEDRARARVADAIAGLDLRLPDGTYPNLEGGQAPNDYQAMFEAAQRASGATPGATFVMTGSWFRSENEAIVTFRITASLPSGPQTFTETGSVVRSGESWLVTRSTVTSMLARSGATPS